MSPVEALLVFVAGPLLLLLVVGGAAWWTAPRSPATEFPLLRKAALPAEPGMTVPAEPAAAAPASPELQEGTSDRS